LKDLAHVPGETPHVLQETPHDPQVTPHEPLVGGQVLQDLDYSGERLAKSDAAFFAAAFVGA
jgi:hypothetical protein